MKKLLVLFILLTIFLSGCGIFNLSFFTLPNDSEFLALVQELNTPEKIGQYMLENFTYKLHNLYAPDPYILWQIQEGDCNDFSTFATFIADYHSYETYQIIISYKDTVYKHALAIYKENGLYTFSDNQYYFPANYDNFFDIVELSSSWMYYSYKYIWSKYIVYDYEMNIIEIIYNN